MPSLLATACDRLLTMYGHWFPYHPGKWRVFRLLMPLASPTWNCPRVFKRQGIWFELDLRHFIPRYIFYLGWEVPETQFVESVVKPGWVIADVGANIGYYTLLFARGVGPSGRVYAFEPAASTYKILMKNISLNHTSKVRPYNMALGDSCGEVSLVQERDPKDYRLAAPDKRSPDTVPLTTLDCFVEEQGLNRLDLIKVDIEGCERRFLLGAKKSLARFRPILLIELNPLALRWFGATVEELVGDLLDSGYRLWRPTWRGFLPLRKLPTRGQYMNVVALHSDAVLRKQGKITSC